MPCQPVKDFVKGGIFINKKAEEKAPQTYIRAARHTKTPGADQLVVNLSGGNQQKVVHRQNGW